MLDSFLIAGLIEARSHERLSLLALNSEDKSFKSLYESLLESEARHFGVYWKLAQTKFSKNQPCLLYTSPSPRDISGSRMPSSA